MQLKTHVMFQSGEAHEAARFYASLTPDAELVADPGDGGPLVVRLAGHELLLFDSPVQHDFGMTPAVSLFLVADQMDEVDAIVERLADGGSLLMPLGEYDFSPRFAWCLDRFGVSWQVTAPTG
jgi:predicted 3-demethylubiquinone-9 3-methyltransferase (glyoxalase superfamily)